MGEQMKTIQDTLKVEIGQLRTKANDLESQVMEIRGMCNTKVGGPELAEIVDKKLAVLQDYRRDTEKVNQKCADIAS